MRRDQSRFRERKTESGEQIRSEGGDVGGGWFGRREKGMAPESTVLQEQARG